MHQPLFKILMTESEHPQLWSSLCDHCVSTETGSSGPSAGLRSTPQLSQSVSICRQTMTSSSSSLFRWITWAPDVSLWTLLSSEWSSSRIQSREKGRGWVRLHKPTLGCIVMVTDPFQAVWHSNIFDWIPQYLAETIQQVSLNLLLVRSWMCRLFSEDTHGYQRRSVSTHLTFHRLQVFQHCFLNLFVFQWEPSRLNENSTFVLGSRANKWVKIMQALWKGHVNNK